MSRGWKIALVVTGVLITAGVVAGTRAAKKSRIPEVTTAKVERQTVVAKVTATGKIQAEHKVDLSALVMGQITGLSVHEGDSVKEGDLLLQIDKTKASAEEAGSAAALRAMLSDLESARTALAQSDRDFARAKANWDAHILSEAEYQRARSAVATARAAADTAQNRVDQFRASLNASRDTLSKTTVRAPIAGIITALRIKAGEVTVLGTMNNPGTQLMTISDMASVLAVLMVDETDVPSVAVGQKAVLSLDSYPGKTFAGEVSEAGQSQITRDDPDLQGLTTTSDAINFKVKVKMADPPAGIRPGFSVTADIITGTRPNVLSVPLAAVIVRDSQTKERTPSGRLKTEEGLYLLEGDHARFVPIQTGLTGELMVEAVGGVKEGQVILTGPFQALRTIKDGDPVRLMPEPDKNKAAKPSDNS